MTDIVVEYIDPVEGDPLYPYAVPKDPETGLFVGGIASEATLTCKVPDGTVVVLTPDITEGDGEYTAVLLTTEYGGGNYIFRWFWNGPTYFGAIEMKFKVNKSKVLN